jgi:serine/threonine-protein kinase
MAKVYLAEDTRLERQVAIKIMHDHLTDDGDYAAKFIREARHTARLAHPNIMSVFDQGHVDDTLYLVMEYLPGMTLRDLLNDYGTLTVEQSLDITQAILQALSVAHREGILHRDVKPENVILVNDGRIKIGDFGLARPVNNATDTGKSLLGTVAYIAPELLTRSQADNRSDLYSVGIMLYEMLTGKQPFTGETPMQVAVQHAQQPMPFASETNPTVSRAIDDVIQWATHKSPTDRPKDARSMLDALTHALTQRSDDDTAATRVIGSAIAPAEIEDSRETQRALPTIPPGATSGGQLDSSQLSPVRSRGRGLRVTAFVIALLVMLGGGG